MNAENKKSCRAIFLNPPTAAGSNEPLLNMAYLASVLRKKDHEAIIIDAKAKYKPLNEQQIEKKIKEFKPDFIGLTLTITYIPETYAYLKRLKKLGIPLVAGGPHANCLPEEVLENGADLVAIGEGEITIVELADHFLGKKKLENIAGICFKKKDGTNHYTKPRPLMTDLDGIPFPDFNDFPIENYTGSKDPDSNSVFWAIFSSRGCPFNCIFCSSHNVFGRTFRARTPQNVFEEVKEIAQKFGAKRFAFQDDEAFINKKRVIEFCKLVRESNLGISFSARLRVDSLGEEMLRAMKSSGFTRLAFGIESFNDESLKKMNKKYTTKQIFDGLKILTRTGFKYIHFNNLVGFPWETPEHLEDCAKSISKIPKEIVYFCGANTLVPYPGTKLYQDNHEKYGFTNWWLEPERNSEEVVPSKGAFFMMFLSSYAPLYSEEKFWHHSKEMKKALVKFCWHVSSMQLKRCLSFWEYPTACWLSKASWVLWKLDPGLEKAVFYLPGLIVKKLGFAEKAQFRNY